jgi:bifunctional ADP-heptose synthase (sugar kinase/adenylyltransferase)
MKVLVIGDSCKDVHVYGASERLCPDAPVPIFVPTFKKTNKGMAGNVYENLLSLGVECDLITNEKEITKTRYVEEKTNYIILRIDSGEEKINRVEGLENINYRAYDAVVISDYDKGFLSKEDILFISEKHPLTFLDTKKLLGPWVGKIKYIKINEVERKKSSHYLISTSLYDKLITTIGSKGCEYQDNIYPVEKVEIKDLSGAGDSFLAALVFMFLQTEDINESLVFANECATKVVQQKGVTLINDI